MKNAPRRKPGGGFSYSAGEGSADGGAEGAEGAVPKSWTLNVTVMA